MSYQSRLDYLRSRKEAKIIYYEDKYESYIYRMKDLYFLHFYNIVFSDKNPATLKRRYNKLINKLPHKVICMYCKEVLKEGKEPISHGCCDPCQEEARKELGLYINKEMK